MSDPNPVLDYLCKLVEAAEDAPVKDDNRHREIVNGVLEFIREDISYIIKFASENRVEDLVNRLEDWV